MARTGMRCPKCKGDMDLGFIMDFAQGSKLVSQWAEGAPQKSFWTVTKMPVKELIPVGTYRCTSCGYLESYARPEFAAH